MAKTSKLPRIRKTSSLRRGRKAKPTAHKTWPKISSATLKAKFATDHKGRRWFEKVFWPDGPCCPSCGAKRDHVRPLKGGGRRTHRCRPCGLRFGVGTAAGLKSTKMDLRTWAIAIHMVTTRPSISSMQMHRDLEVTQTTAWRMRRRLLAAHKLSVKGARRSAKPCGTYTEGRDRIGKKAEDWEMAAVELALKVPKVSTKYIPTRSKRK